MTWITGCLSGLQMAQSKGGITDTSEDKLKAVRISTNLNSES